MKTKMNATFNPMTKNHGSIGGQIRHCDAQLKNRLKICPTINDIIKKSNNNPLNKDSDDYHFYRLITDAIK